MKKILAAMTISFSIFLGLSACGQSGPLYLPDNPPPKSTTTGH